MGISNFREADTEYWMLPVISDRQIVRQFRMLKKDIQLPRHKYPSNILFSISLMNEDSSEHHFVGKKITTYHQKVVAVIDQLEISKTLDWSIPQGIEIFSPWFFSKDIKTDDIQIKGIHLKHRGKKVKRDKVFNDFLEAGKKRDSWFTSTLKRLEHQTTTRIVNSLGARKLISSSKYTRMLFAPFLGKTIVAFRFVPYPLNGRRVGEPQVIINEGIQKEVRNCLCEKGLTKSMFKVMARSEELVQQFDVGGTQTADVANREGSPQYEIMQLAKERFLPDSPSITMADILAETETISHLRSALVDEVSKGEWAFSHGKGIGNFI